MSASAEQLKIEQQGAQRMSLRTHATKRRLISGAAGAGLLTGALVVPALTGAHLRAGDPCANVRLPARQRRPARHQHRLRQRALLPGQPERPVRPRADAAPAQLPGVERHGVLELAHADDRPHRRRQPVDLHRPVRRPARPAGVNTYNVYNPDGTTDTGDVLHVLDVADHRHQDPRCPRRARSTSRRR